MKTHTYKGHTIDRNLDGKWIVTYKNGSHSQHSTLADAKEAVTAKIEVAELPDDL